MKQYRPSRVRWPTQNFTIYHSVGHQPWLTTNAWKKLKSNPIFKILIYNFYRWNFLQQKVHLGQPVGRPGRYTDVVRHLVQESAEPSQGLCTLIRKQLKRFFNSLGKGQNYENQNVESRKSEHRKSKICQRIIWKWSFWRSFRSSHIRRSDPLAEQKSKPTKGNAN